MSLKNYDELSPLEDRFALRVAQGDSPIPAYRFANPEAMQWEDVETLRYVNALMARSRVKARIAEYKINTAANAKRTLPEHIRQLEKLRDQAIADGLVQHAIKAEELIGKVSGLYVEKKEISGANGGPVSITIRKQVIDVSEDLL